MALIASQLDQAGIAPGLVAAAVQTQLRKEAETQAHLIKAVADAIIRGELDFTSSRFEQRLNHAIGNIDALFRLQEKHSNLIKVLADDRQQRIFEIIQQDTQAPKKPSQPKKVHVSYTMREKNDSTEKHPGGRPMQMRRDLLLEPEELQSENPLALIQQRLEKEHEGWDVTVSGTKPDLLKASKKPKQESLPAEEPINEPEGTQ